MVSTRQGLIDYALRYLGAPLLEINVDESQIEDRIDEALDYFRLYHYDGIEKVYLKHKITASKLEIAETNALDFVKGKIITGQTSGATAQVHYQVNEEQPNNVIYAKGVTGIFELGETIECEGVTATLESVTIGDIDNRWIPIDDWIYGISRIIPFTNTGASRSMFDLQYQLRLHDLYDLTSTSLIYYKMMMGHLALLDLELNGKPLFRFNRMNNKLYLDINWDYAVRPGDHIVIECYRALDPSEAAKTWNEPWLKLYATCLIKKQWASNLKKFGGMQLPGGIILDGNALYNEAVQEQKMLEDDLMTKSATLDFYMG